MTISLTSFDVKVLTCDLQRTLGAYFEKAFMLETGEIIIRFQIRLDRMDIRLLDVLPATFEVKYSKRLGSGSDRETDEPSGSCEGDSWVGENPKVIDEGSDDVVSTEALENATERDVDTTEHYIDTVGHNVDTVGHNIDTVGHNVDTVRHNVDTDEQDIDTADQGKGIALGGREGAGNYAKFSLFFIPGKAAFLTDRSFRTPMVPHSFAMLMRKHLRNARITSVRQHQFDRILLLDLTRGDDTYTLVLELFGDGNAILVRNDMIIQPLFPRSYGSRKVRARREMAYPPERYDPASKDEDELAETIDLSENDLVRCLAMDLNLGGALSERILRDLAMDKNRDAGALSQQERRTLAGTVRGIFEQHARSGRSFVYRKGTGVESIGRMPVEGHSETENVTAEGYPSFNRALETVFIEELKGSDGDGVIMEADEKGGEGAEPPRISRIRRKITQQERAIERFGKEAERNREIADLIYLNYQRLEAVLGALGDARERLGWDEVRERIKDIPDIISVDPADSTAVVRILTESGEGREVAVSVKKNVNDNAAVYFDRVKKGRAKMKGARTALEHSMAELKKAEEAETKKPSTEETASGPRIRKRERRFWFESYRWFVSSDGNVVVGGKDARSNEKVVKKYLDQDARYVHTEIHGSPSVIVRPREGQDGMSEGTLLEAGAFSACFSRAWHAKVGSQTAYWVKTEQVSKTPQSGEFLPRGSFIIRGKRNWMPKLEMRLCIGKVVIEEEDKVMCGPPEAVEKHSSGYLIIVPGEEKKDLLAKKIARVFGVQQDRILSILPPGGSRVVDSRGIDEGLLRDVGLLGE